MSDERILQRMTRKELVAVVIGLDLPFFGTDLRSVKGLDIRYDEETDMFLLVETESN